MQDFVGNRGLELGKEKQHLKRTQDVAGRVQKRHTCQQDSKKTSSHWLARDAKAEGKGYTWETQEESVVDG